MLEEIGNRQFSAQDISSFATASGDYNPIHTDPISARRLLAGDIVVHGMYLLLWALDCHFASGGVVPQSIKAYFKRYVLSNEQVTVGRIEDENGGWRLSILRGDEEVAGINLFGISETNRHPLQAERPLRTAVQNKGFTDLKNESGSLPVMAKPDDLFQLFAWASESLGLSSTAAVMLLSRLAGMECPGLNSLISGLSLTLDSDRRHDVSWQVVRHSSAYAPVRLQVKGGGIEGHLDVFVRPSLVNQPSMAAIKTQIESLDLKQATALIIGGSRGLGELTAKILAAGGAQLMVSYKTDPDDARRVVEEINTNGGRSDLVHGDVSQPEALIKQLKSRDFVPTHIYYYATPHITVNQATLIDSALLNKFNQIYVQDFEKTVYSFSREYGGTQRFFYPSTVFLDESVKYFREYIAAKAAGEAMCKYLNRNVSNARILIKRLPRLSTDQTASIIPQSVKAALPVMVQVIKEFHSAEI